MDGTRIYGLTIGVDCYANKSQHLERLTGAVADADDMEKFLLECGASRTRLRRLRNETATRKNIIFELERLARLPDIQRNDPIVIFFAGHGASPKSPDGLSTFQAIVPVDCGYGPSGEVVHGISDRTIQVLIDNLAHEKGDNIVSAFLAPRCGEPAEARLDRIL